MKGTRIIGTGSYLPKKVLTNFDLEKIVDTSDTWIRTRTGIVERHIANDKEASSDLVVEAAKKALEMASLKPKDIDTIIVGTISPDTLFPSTGCWVGAKLGIPGVPAFDLSAACSGFLYGLIVADGLIKSGSSRRVLVAGVEVLSRVLNWEDRTTCVLFGDGAGVAIVEESDDDSGILSSYWGADGSLGDLLIQPAGGSRMPATHETVEKKLHTVHMKGNDVFKHAVRTMALAAEKVLNDAGVKPRDITLFIPHQANIRIIDATIKRFGIPREKTVVTIDKIANISSATIPISLDMTVREGRIKKGDLLLFDAFGGGFTWGAVLMRW
ncbi:MAG: 3-oxoacyl-ACP synthase [Candidatus Cloacimonas sp. 4484_209]|nr:MAG: 3-oxoacyl-ACP synthase [Candidatus Cloacimonas sp. 4484_209]